MSEKNNIKKRPDIWFVWNAVALALLALAVLHTIEPYIQPDDPNKPKAMDYAAGIRLVEASEVPQLLKSDKPTLLVVYASWCDTCRKKMPHIVQLVRDGRLDHVNTVFLSLDKSAMQLAQYLLRTDIYRDIGTPYLHDQNLFDSGLVATMKTTGSQFKGAIPFTELFSPEGRALAFIPHYVGNDALVKATGGE
ncbi:MAG: TlpA family protein disulfide reductase [Alphaproteobacteria bacterium]